MDRRWPALTGPSGRQHCSRSHVTSGGQSIRAGDRLQIVRIYCIGSWSLGRCDQTFFVRSFDKSGMSNLIVSAFAKSLEAALLVLPLPRSDSGGVTESQQSLVTG